MIIDLNQINNLNHLANDKIAYVEDKTGEISFENIKSSFQTLYSNTQNYKLIPKISQINFGQSSSAFWFCFKIQDSLFNAQKRWILKIEHPSLDNIEFYYQNNVGIYKTIRTGDKGKFLERDIKSTRLFAFHLPIHSANVHTFYFRIKGEGILTTPLSFYENDDYYKYALYEETWMGSYYGIMLVLSLYNLFLYFVLRNAMYLFYVGWMVFSALFSASIAGHSFQYFFYDSPYLAEFFLIFSGFFSLVSLTIFIQLFLRTKEKIKYAHNILDIIKYISVAIPIYYLVSNNYKLSVGVLTLLPPFTSLFVLAICFYGIYKRLPSAVLISFAFFGSLLGAVIYGFKQSNLVFPHNFFTNNAPYMGFIIQGVIFSLALADRYKQLKKQFIDTQKEANENLEKKVAQRTEELQNMHQEMITQNEELQQSQEEILAQRDAIERKNIELSQINSQIQSSIKAAQVIQKAIVPYQQKKEELLKEHFVIYKPKDVVSGDFYWLNKIENTTFLAVIDCTGHGVPGAFMTLITNNLLDKIVRVWGIYSPASILERLQEEIEIVLRQKETDNNYGMDASIITITPQNDEFEIIFAGAKQNLYFVNSQENTLQSLLGTRKSIGGFQSPEILFENQKIILQKNDKLYMTTDGYIDQNNKSRKRITEKRFIELIDNIKENDMSEQKRFLQDFLQKYMENTTQRDDISVIGLKL